MSWTFLELLLTSQIRKSLSSDRPNIICLSRPVFDYDISALNRFQKKFHFADFRFPWSRLYPFSWVPWYRNMGQVSFFESEELTKELFAPLTAMLTRAMTPLRGSFDIRGVMSANYNYFQDEPYLQYCRELELPFFVLLKEHPYSKKLRDIRHEWNLGKSKFPERGHIGLFGGENSMLYVDDGMISSERAFVTGFPRFDYYLNTSTPHSSGTKREILLVDFGSGILYPTRDFPRVLETTASWCLSRGFRLTVKSKDLRQARETSRLVAKLSRPLREITRIVQGMMASHVSNCAGIVASESTAAYEALLTSSPLILYREEESILDIDLGEQSLVREAGNIRSLVDCLTWAAKVRGDDLVEVKQSRIEEFRRAFHLPGETASSEVAKIIEAC